MGIKFRKPNRAESASSTSAQTPRTTTVTRSTPTARTCPRGTRANVCLSFHWFFMAFHWFFIDFSSIFNFLKIVMLQAKKASTTSRAARECRRAVSAWPSSTKRCQPWSRSPSAKRHAGPTAVAARSRARWGFSFRNI
jgi:hypothetical protein